MVAVMDDFGLSKIEVAKELLFRKQSKRDLTKFCKLVSDIEAARHHRVLIEKLEDIAYGRNDRLMVFMPPGHAKSTYSSVHFPAFYLGVNQKNCIIGASHTQDLAERFSKKARAIVQSTAYHETFGFGIAQDSRAVAAWETERGGEFKAAGVGAGIAGRRSDVGLIDDPIRSREDAESEGVRDRVWEWYLADFRTRLKPNGSICIIQCMVGDTKVLLADGSEKDLKDIKVGDEVATYYDGHICNRKVLNWVNQGSDKVFSVKTTSRIIRANERHPFLVQTNTGELKWIRLKNLKPGMALVSMKDAIGHQEQKQSQQNVTLANQEKIITKKTQMPKAKELGIMENTKVLIAHQMDVMSQHIVGNFVESITDNTTGLTQTKSVKPKKLSEQDILSTDMESQWMSITQSLNLKEEFVPSVSSLQQVKTHDPTGKINSALTIATKAEKLDLSCVTTAILHLDTQKLGRSPFQLQNISDFTVEIIESIDFDCEEDVFDIQVEGTENFIANGIVVSNTRWHPDDLSGRILPPDYHGQSGKVVCAGGEVWEVVNFPAICEQNDDILGRKVGEALWPEYYTLEMLLEAKKMQTPRNWSSLYQQRPRPDDANQFDVETFLIDGSPVPYPKFCDTIFAVIDTATKDGAKHDSTAVTYFAYSKYVGNPLIILDYDMVQIEGAILVDWLPSVIERCEDYAKTCGARLGSAGAFIEDKASGAVVIQQARRNGLPVQAIDSPLTMLGKSERAINVSPYCCRGLVKFSEHAYNKRIVHKGRERNQLLFQITNFRVGFDNKSDDLLDTFTYGISLALGDSDGF